MQIYTKDPDATLDYGFDWSNWFEDGEGIDSVEVTVDTGLTENSGDRETSNSVVKVWLTGGEVGKQYRVSCEITTDNSPSRTDERSIIIEVAER